MNVCRIVRVLALVVLACLCLLTPSSRGEEAAEVEMAVHGGAEVLRNDEVTKTLTPEENDTIAQIVATLAQTEAQLASAKEKEVALLEKLTAAARVEEEHAILKAQFDAMAAELAALKAQPAPEPVMVKDPATDAALVELKAQHGRLQEEAAALKQKVAVLETKPVPEPVKEQVMVKDPATEAELVELKAQHGRLQEEAAALKQKVGELQREAQSAASAGKPKLSNRADAPASAKKAAEKKADGADSSSFSGLKELEEFGVFLVGKYDAFMADVYASQTYAQVAASAGPMLEQAHTALVAQFKLGSRFIFKVALPYLRNDLGPQLAAFYVNKVVPFAADAQKFALQCYTAARPHALELARAAHAFVVHTAVPAYEKHVRPPVVAFYTDVVVGSYNTHVKPTVDVAWREHVAPWYQANLAPHVATASSATAKLYRTHLRKHVEPVWNTASRHVNKWLYKAADLLDGETLADNAAFLLSDGYHLAALAHETATAALRRHPTMRAVFGKNLEAGISLVVYGVVLLVLILLRPVVFAVLRPVLYIVFSPLLLVWWLIFGGKRVPRNARKAPAATRSAHSSSSSSSSGHERARYSDEAYPPSAAGKPDRPPRSSINPQPAGGPAFIGSPVPYHSTTGDHDT